MTQADEMTKSKDTLPPETERSTASAQLVSIETPRPIETAEQVEQTPVSAEPEAVTLEAEGPSKSRKRAKAFGIGTLVALGGIIAWYPLSDHYAPFASGGSITAQVTQIAPRVAGPVSAIFIADNATVKAGEPLFQIDNSTFKMDVEQAKAQLEQALNSVTSSVAAIPAAEAKVEQAKVSLTIAEQELERTAQLHDKDLVSVAKLNTADANHRNALLNVEAAAADLERVRTAASTADSSNPNVRAAQAAVDKAEFALANTTIVAPADGYISNLLLADGQFVAAGTAAMTFINPSTQMVIVDLRENQLLNVKPGDKAKVVFEAAPGRQFEATVDSIAWGINSGRTSVNGLAQSSTDTRWFPPARKVPVRVTIDDISALPPNVRLGSEASVLIIPQDGIVPAIASALLGVSSVLSGFN